MSGHNRFDPIFDWIPEPIRNEIGHFNVFNLEHFDKPGIRPTLLCRTDYFKIALIPGKCEFILADKIIEIQQQSLVFMNPPGCAKWEITDKKKWACYCVFNREFFRHYENTLEYEIFQSNGIHVFDLSEEQENKLTGYFTRMLDEINSDYLYKYDALRNLVFEVMHFAMKMQSKPSLK